MADSYMLATATASGLDTKGLQSMLRPQSADSWTLQSHASPHIAPVTEEDSEASLLLPAEGL